MLLGLLGGSSQACLRELQIRFSGWELPDRHQTDTESKVKTDVAWTPGWELSDLLL